MPADPVKETITAEVVARLERLFTDTTSAYHFALGQSVQRYKHQWDADEHITNTDLETPAVFVFRQPESQILQGADVEIDLSSRSLTFEIWYIHSGEDSDDDVMLKVEADIEKALFNDLSDVPDVFFGVNSSAIQYSVRALDSRDEMPRDGVVATLSFDWKTVIGDPTTSA